MNIALIAHDKKKELMVQFCIAYSGILSKHSLYATGTTGKMIIENTGLNVYRFLSGPQGGDQGGQLMFAGTPQAFKAEMKRATARYL